MEIQNLKTIDKELEELLASGNGVLTSYKILRKREDIKWVGKYPLENYIRCRAKEWGYNSTLNIK